MTLRLGHTAPHPGLHVGPIHLHDYLGTHWGLLFSHPALTDGYSVATPVNWNDGEDDVIIVPSLEDPGVTKEQFPKGFKAMRPYLRYAPQPNR